MNRASTTITLLLFALLAVNARAQNASTAASEPNDPTGLWDSDVMMEQATINISRRYNLDDAQEEFTRQLLRKRTTEFLADHEDELRNLLKDLFLRQLRGETPTPEQVREWGERAEPLLDEARKAILEGNGEWRDILDEKQRKIHDIDLRLMDRNFQTLEERFGRWSNGEFRAGDWLRAGTPKPKTTGNNPRVEIAAPPPEHIRKSEDFWDLYVKKFIRDYDLDEAQQNSALAVLTDMKEKAARARKQSEAEQQAAQAALHTLIREKAPTDKIKEATKRMRATQNPISKLFDEFRARLARIPTEAQLKRVSHDYISEALNNQSGDSKSADSKSKDAARKTKAAPSEAKPDKGEVKKPAPETTEKKPE